MIKDLIKQNDLKDIIDIKLINNNELDITIKKDLTVNIKGDINLVVNNLNIDTPDGKIHLNSRLAKQIKDDTENVLYRNAIAKRQELIMIHQEEINILLKKLKEKFQIDFEL